MTALWLRLSLLVGLSPFAERAIQVRAEEFFSVQGEAGHRLPQKSLILAADVRRAQRTTGVETPGRRRPFLDV